MITGFSQVIQLSVFIKSIGAGFFICLLFCLNTALNAVNGKNSIPVAIRDVLFILSATVITFLFALKYNAGIIRFYILAGEATGFIMCYIFCASIVRRTVKAIYLYLCALLKKSFEKIFKKTKKVGKNT